MANHLAGSTSPYLLQHQHNPVDWYPWGPEALERARKEDRPIFLSIGYAACHWCHVMERESFEDPQVAKLLNERFICIKVDREERPDLDQIYMIAVQMLTGHGGWPMNVFLTPQGEPFYGGTYWPPRPRHGLPAFGQIVMAVGDAWQERRQDILEQAVALTEEVRGALMRPGQIDEAAGGLLSKDLLFTAGKRLVDVLDRTWGGFGGAPKFPHCSDLELLLRLWFRTQQTDYLEAVTITLDRMAAGGIYDHLGGGFSRYSVDREWLVPHFEKMLYDNAQLATLYLLGFQATGKGAYAVIAEDTLDYLLRDMRDDAGGLHSSEDADSEGVEGKFYVWTAAEIGSVLGTQRGEQFCKVYGVTAHGNFEGFNILHLPHSIEAAAEKLGVSSGDLIVQLLEDRRTLLAARTKRIRPGRDDKVLTNWNALAVQALALASRMLERPDFLQAAETIVEFLWSKMRDPQGRLLHAFRDGQAHLNGYLDDYSYLTDALLSLFEATGEARWIERAMELANTILNHFRDPKTGGLFYTSDDHEALVARSKDYVDASVPSSAGSAAVAWLRLYSLTGDTKWHEAAERVLLDAVPLMQKQPGATGRLLHALDLYLGPNQQIVALAPDAKSLAFLWPIYFGRFRPRSELIPMIVQSEADHAASILKNLVGEKTLQNGEPTVYVCENFRCLKPRTGFSQMDAVDPPPTM